MTEGLYTIVSNRALTASVWEMTLTGDTSALVRPGQFVNIRLAGRYLRRPISVCDWRDGELTLIYKVVGGGTEQMSRLRPGDTLNLLCGLGNGFDPARAGARPLLIGGGVGTPPMIGLARALREAGAAVTAVLGFNTAAEIFGVDRLEALGATVRVATADGSAGVRGFVTDALDGLDPTHYYACGPEPMLRAVHGALACGGELSFEQRMGCGFGACMGCTCRTITGNKRICREGPVLQKEEILW